MNSEAEPGRVLVAGDWHANMPWALGVVDLLPVLLPDESPRLILHLGDFGIWPTSRLYLMELTRALREVDAELWFIDGNHENFDQLHDMIGDSTSTDPVRVCESITWLPRGHRWVWHGRTWLALGGAVSVDRALRREGVDWWPDEEITEAQARRARRGGRADVMVCHDAPSSVPLRLPPPSPAWALRDLARSDRHRERLQEVANDAMPTHLFHGHYHLSHETTVSMGHGPVSVVGLDCDSATSGNFQVLSTRTMTVEPAPRTVAGHNHMRSSDIEGGNKNEPVQTRIRSAGQARSTRGRA